jgi:serine/threonine protein phosphatase PrpC
VKLVAGKHSDVGQVREQNEDALLVDEKLALYAVADGMGGHRGGEVASATSLEALRAAVSRGESIIDAIKAANAAVYEAAADDPNLSGMGTTLTAVIALGGSSLLVGHVGDSRAYLVRKGSIEQLTEDHSLVEELVREGRLTREQADVHPQRAIVTRAVGVGADVDVDLYVLGVAEGDRLVLCSDGLNTMLRDRDIARIARADDDPQVVAERLVDAANEAGGEDNITALVLDVVEVDATGPPDPETLARFGLPPDLQLGPGQSVGPVEMEAAPARGPDDRATAELVVAYPRRRLARLRLVVFVVVPVVVVLVVATSVLAWYARRSFFVGLHGTEVVVYRGVPGGVLVWEPTVERRTGIRARQLRQVDLAAVRAGTAEGSRSAADAYVRYLRRNLRYEATEPRAPTTTTTKPRPAPTPAPTVSVVPLGTA